jgi:hypothetical protein
MVVVLDGCLYKLTGNDWVFFREVQYKDKGRELW